MNDNNDTILLMCTDSSLIGAVDLHYFFKNKIKNPNIAAVEFLNSKTIFKA